MKPVLSKDPLDDLLSDNFISTFVRQQEKEIVDTYKESNPDFFEGFDTPKPNNMTILRVT